MYCPRRGKAVLEIGRWVGNVPGIACQHSTASHHTLYERNSGHSSTAGDLELLVAYRTVVGVLGSAPVRRRFSNVLCPHFLSALKSGFSRLQKGANQDNRYSGSCVDGQDIAGLNMDTLKLTCRSFLALFCLYAQFVAISSQFCSTFTCMAVQDKFREHGVVPDVLDEPPTGLATVREHASMYTYMAWYVKFLF